MPRPQRRGGFAPSRDKRAKGHTGADDETPVGRYWNRTTVSGILADRVYVGDMVQGKTRKQWHKTIQVPPSEWVTVQNTHEAILGGDLFEDVQAVLRNACTEAVEKRSPAVPFTPALFKGKVFCGHCGYALKRCRQNKDQVYWLRCVTQNKHSHKACIQVSIKEEDLKTGAVAMLRSYAQALLGHKAKLCKKAMEKQPSEAARETQRRQLQRDSETNRQGLRRLFEQLLAGEITKAEFAVQKKEYERKSAALSKSLLELETSPRQLQRRVKECWELADCVGAAKCKYDLTVDLLDALVEKILVYHDKSFEIVWRFSEPFAQGGDLEWAM